MRANEIIQILVLLMIASTSLLAVSHSGGVYPGDVNVSYYSGEKASLIGSWALVTTGSAETVEVTFTITIGTGSTGLAGTVKYVARVKEPPWIAKVYGAIMQYYDYGYGGFITGGAIGSGLAKKDVLCWWPGQTRAYYVDYEKTIYAYVTPGEYWYWEGEWYLRINEDRCLWPDSTAYNGYPYLYAAHKECWGPLCG